MDGKLTAAALLAVFGAAACHTSGRTHLARGNVLANAGQLEPALAEYRAAGADDPALAEPWLRMGDLLYREGKKDEALAAYRQAVARAPAAVEAWIGMARVQSDEGRDRDARASLSRALDARPKNLYARLSRARLALQDGDGAAALSDARIAARLEDSNPTVLYVYGEAMIAARDFSGAAAAFDRIAKLDPGGMLADDGRARLAMARGDREEAARALAAIVARAPEERAKIAADPAFAGLRRGPDEAAGPDAGGGIDSAVGAK